MLTARIDGRDASAGAGAICSACAEELARWAHGGYHLTCRACELEAIARATEERAAFYARLAQLARVAVPKRTGASRPNLSAPE